MKSVLTGKLETTYRILNQTFLIFFYLILNSSFEVLSGIWPLFMFDVALRII